MTDLSTHLSGNRYPGRGILYARIRSGAHVVAYFLTGRSPASRERTLHIAGDDLVVAPSAAAGHDPLRHYTAAENAGDWLVVGNGEQVTQVADRVRAGAPAQLALGDLEYEPDPPIHTSRVTALVSRDGGRVGVLGAARRSRGGGRAAADVMTLTVRDLAPGDAVLLTTYDSDGDSVATAAPYVECGIAAEHADGLLDEIWAALNPKLRIAAAVLDPAEGPAGALLRAD
ncbi:IMP cyclohydrolase [Streptomyces sp. NPDC057236]|uniref:IMP cyclohydrolase n=1 Tax=Streptomyces sp. NPDC057236 TaxID=3346059 RepID=UPI003629DE2A